MVIIQFLKRTNPKDIKRIVLLTVIAGFANALLIVVINKVANLVALGKPPGIIMSAIFLVAFVLYFQCNKRALLSANSVIERLLKDLRVEIVDKLRKSELWTVNSLGRGKLYLLLSHETNHLSIAFPILVESFQQMVLLGAALIYLGYLSWAALLVFLLAILVGVFGYLHINQSYRDTLQHVADQEAHMLDMFGDIIHGSSELRLNSRRSEAVSKAFADHSLATEELLSTAGTRWTSMILLSAFVTFSMLGIVVFVFPQYIDQHSTIVFQLVPTLMFCLAPLSKIIAQSPIFLRSDVGLRGIFAMQEELEAASGVTPAQARKEGQAFHDFKQISFTDITYHHRDKNGNSLFTSGPWDIALNRGELLFLVGGNGSGKSTALRLLTGLYRRNGGQVTIDSVEVNEAQFAGVRELFTAIFADFHLFDRLYGLEHVKPEEVERLIDMMELTGKVKFVDGHFSELHLSTGQRKRLALIAALLEDRPVYLFDEWSAEQDIHFREIFYTRILPDLKAQGKTVVVVTHDERFWHLADRVIKFELGKVEWERSGDMLDASH